MALALAGWLGTGLGLAVSSFQAPPAWIDVAPAVINFLGLGVFQVGAATFETLGSLAQFVEQKLAA